MAKANDVNNTASADIDALSPESSIVVLSSGTEVRVERLKTRGMFKLLRVITRGAGPILAGADLDFNDSEAFVGQLLAITVMAIPEAEDEAIEFIKSMVVPTEFDVQAKTKAAKQRNAEVVAEMDAELDDPEIDDLISIIETIIHNEAHDIQALGKRLGSILKTQNLTQN